MRNSPHYGGSGVFTTVEDFAKWDAEFDSPRVLGHAVVAQMMHREKFAHDKDNDAFGLVIGDFEGREMVWFSGGDLDGSTFFARLPKERLTVVCLSNMPTGDAEARAKAVLHTLLDSERTSRRPHPPVAPTHRPLRSPTPSVPFRPRPVRYVPKPRLYASRPQLRRLLFRPGGGTFGAPTPPTSGLTRRSWVLVFIGSPAPCAASAPVDVVLSVSGE